MSSDSPDDSLTGLLRAAHAGDHEAAERAYRILYPELCKIARAHLRAHRPDTLLDTRGLVLEGYLNLTKVDGALFENRKHFYAYAAKVMRRIVIDFARRRQSCAVGQISLPWPPTPLRSYFATSKGDGEFQDALLSLVA